MPDNNDSSDSSVSGKKQFARLTDAAMSAVMPLLPKDDLSHWVGRIVHAERLPSAIRQLSMRAFVKAYAINMDEAEKPISEYRSIGDLFTRRLKPGARPIASEEIIHPCDARILQAGSVIGGKIIQVKGIEYGARDLVADDTSFEGGAFATYYLCPTDYHRVHAPMDLLIERVTHIPGQFWPVNDWSVRRVKSLYAINERVVFWGQTVHGDLVALVMVAATNVGNISVAFDSSISSRIRTRDRRRTERSYGSGKTKGHSVCKGDELGVFAMGSSVVLLLDARARERMAISEERLTRLVGAATRLGTAF